MGLMGSAKILDPRGFCRFSSSSSLFLKGFVVGLELGLMACLFRYHFQQAVSFSSF